MTTYKLYYRDPKTDVRYSKIFYETLRKRSDYLNYLIIESNYINIVYSLICGFETYFLEIDFFFQREEPELSYYSSEERFELELLKDVEEGTQKRINEDQLPLYIKFILREHIRAQILIDEETYIFGYIDDLVILICTEKLENMTIKDIEAKGFVIDEFNFDIIFDKE
jgi:hypothetical protein